MKTKRSWVDVRKLKLMAATTTCAVALSGCFNMPTAPSQITGSYISTLKYDNVPCPQLAAESDSLSRRENQLVTAQQQRIKTSQMQAFWLGFGEGDGVEASELANVRGEQEAVRKELDIKQCGKGSAVSSAQPQSTVARRSTLSPVWPVYP